jgi:chromosome segregation ATPase
LTVTVEVYGGFSMSQFSWESGVVAESQPEQQPEVPAADTGTLSLSADDFAALEERILRAVNLVKRERAAREAAEQRATEAEAQLREQQPLVDGLRKELDALRAEREQVRQRVERLLAQLDALEV